MPVLASAIENVEKNESQTLINHVELLQQKLDQYEIQLKSLENQNEKFATQLEQQADIYQNAIKKSDDAMVNLSHQQEELRSNLTQTNQSLSLLSSNTQSGQKHLDDSVKQLSKDTEVKTSKISQQLSDRTIATLVGLFLLLGLIAAGYFLLTKRHNEIRQDLTKKLQVALERIQEAEENIVQSDMQLSTELFKILEQIQLENQKQSALLATGASSHSSAYTPTSHDLAIKLADEIHRMQKRIQALPEDIKGLKSLNKSLERLEEELNEQGYEIIDYLDMTYTENMSVKARFIPSDEIEDGQSIITKVVYPQVNYQDKLIRMADVEVSVG